MICNKTSKQGWVGLASVVFLITPSGKA